MTGLQLDRLYHHNRSLRQVLATLAEANDAEHIVLALADVVGAQATNVARAGQYDRAAELHRIAADLDEQSDRLDSDERE